MQPPLAGANDASDPAAHYVQSLARGLSVIRVFDAESPELRLIDVARASGLTRATARRFLLTLVDLGYVRTDGRVFALTPKVLELGYSYISALTLPEIAQPHLEKLAALVHESTSTSVLDGLDVVYVARVSARRIMSVGISIGTRFPAYATAMGRVLLASLEPGERDRHVDPNNFRPLTERTIVSEQRLLAELDTVRAQGWCVVDQELEIGLRSIAVPLMDASGRVIAAVNVSGRATGDHVDEFIATVLPQLTLTAQAINRELHDSKPFSTLQL